MKRYIITGLIIAALSGCAANGAKPSTVQTIETACASVSASIKTLSLPIARDKLSPTAIAAVNQALAVVTPVCASPTAPTSLDVVKLDEIKSAVSTLQTFAAYNTSPSTAP